jgi:ABC-2 type transport system permease protein
MPTDRSRLDLRQVAHIAAREVHVGVRMRSFWIGMVISCVFIVALALVPRLLAGQSGPNTVTLAATPEAVAALPADGTAVPGVTIRPVDSAAAAASALDEGDVAGTVSVVDGRVAVLVADSTDEAAGAATAEAVRTGLLEAMVVGAAEGSVTLPASDVRSLTDSSGDAARLVLAYIVSIVLFTQIAGLGASVAQGTMEEKTTRVVDILFSRVRPVSLLVGKVVGTGLFGLIQMAVLALVGIGAVRAFGTAGLQDLIAPAALVSIAWFVLGFAFYGFIYGAVASTAKRPETLSSSLLPLQLLNAAVFVVAILALQGISDEWVRVMSLVPPFSAILMPMRLATGTVPAVDVATSVLVIVTATAVAAVVGARIYRRSITGARSRSRRPAPSRSRAERPAP